METIHYYFYAIKIIILIAIILMRFKIIPVDGKYYIIIEGLFKISLSLYIIVFFGFNKFKIDKHDRILFIVSGFILLSLIDYDELYRALTTKYKDFLHENNSS